MDLSRRSSQKELLDRDDIPFEDIKRNMHELDFINTYLGGHAITIQGAKVLLNNPSIPKTILVCEIGCGGGSNLLALAKWFKKQNIAISFIGIDINPDCIAVAKNACADLETEFITSDYKTVTFTKTPDIIFSSLFCHHFSNLELVEMLRWMRNNSSIGFFINDLQRHAAAFLSIKILTTIFSKSYLVKNDAPLSVARGFKRIEIEELLTLAGIESYSIEWKWAFRWLVVVKH